MNDKALTGKKSLIVCCFEKRQGTDHKQSYIFMEDYNIAVILKMKKERIKKGDLKNVYFSN